MLLGEPKSVPTALNTATRCTRGSRFHTCPAPGDNQHRRVGFCFFAQEKPCDSCFSKYPPTTNSFQHSTKLDEFYRIGLRPSAWFHHRLLTMLASSRLCLPPRVHSPFGAPGHTTHCPPDSTCVLELNHTQSSAHIFATHSLTCDNAHSHVTWTPTESTADVPERFLPLPPGTESVPRPPPPCSSALESHRSGAVQCGRPTRRPPGSSMFSRFARGRVCIVS